MSDDPIEPLKNILLEVETETLNLEEEPLSIITENHLYGNYPNPFNPITTIEFDLKKAGKVSLKIFNILGEEIATLLSASLFSGSYKYKWDASGLASGVYLYRLQAGDYVKTRKMVLMR
jgi:hypothetical protein